MIFGGLELVVGGVVLHQYNKKKNEKKRCEEEWKQRRQNTYPGVRPQQPSHQHQPPHPQYLHEQQYPQQHQQQQQQHLAIPQQKYACYAPQPQLQPFSPISPNSPNSPNSPILHRPHTAQTFPQPYPHPSPQLQPQYQQQPIPWIQQPSPHPLHRTDTFASISNMPVANGLSSHQTLHPQPHPPPNATYYLQPISPISPMTSPYGNPGFSRSTPNFSHSGTELRFDNSASFGRNTVDDLDAYETNNGAPPPRVNDGRAEDDENDPPPPYRP